MSSSNCCFLTCIQVSQEAGQVVWYSHLFQNFPQFIVIHTVKGFGIVNKAEIDVFLELYCFFSDLMDVGNLISVSSAFSKSRLYIWKFSVYCFILIFIFNLPFSSKVSLLKISQIHLLSKFNSQSTFLHMDFCNTHLTIQPTSMLAFFNVFSTSYLE